jgi:hypothetical protein
MATAALVAFVIVFREKRRRGSTDLL